MNNLSEILVQTVVLSSNTTPEKIELFRCYHCGTGISKIQGDIIAITPGTVPSKDLAVITQCRRCKENYILKTLPDKSEYIKLILAPTPDNILDKNYFRCIKCRNILIEYKGEKAFSYLTGDPLALPAKIICDSLDCSRKYLLKDIVSVIELS